MAPSLKTKTRLTSPEERAKQTFIEHNPWKMSEEEAVVIAIRAALVELVEAYEAQFNDHKVGYSTVRALVNTILSEDQRLK